MNDFGAFGLLPSSCFDDRRMTGDLIKTLGCIATWCQGRSDGWWAINQRQVARRLSVARETVNRRVHRLVAYDYLEVRPNWRADGGQGPNSYRINVYATVPVEFRAGLVIVDNPPDNVDNDTPPVTPDRHTPVTPDRHTPVTPDRHTPVTVLASHYIDTDHTTDQNTDQETDARTRATSSSRKKVSRRIPDAWRGGDQEACEEWAKSAVARGVLDRLGFQPLNLFRSGRVYRKTDKQAAYRVWCDDEGIECLLPEPLKSLPAGGV